MTQIPDQGEWGWSALRLVAVAALMAAAVYGADVLLVMYPGAIPGMPQVDAASARVRPACIWESSESALCGTVRSAAFEPEPLFDRVQTYEALEGNDLHQRATRVRAKLDLDLDAIRHGDSVAVCLRDLAWRAGMAFRWDGVGPARIRSEDGLLVVEPGKPVCRRNFIPVQLQAAPFIKGEDLYLSLNAAAMAFRAQLAREGGAGVYVLTGLGKPLRIISNADAFHIEIDRSDRWLRVTYAGHLIKHYGACTGQGQNTPVGSFHIQNKSVWPGWRAYWGEFIPGGSSRNPLGARFLGTSARGRATGWTIGIHGTNQPSSIGRRISGGCVRLLNQNAIELYEVIPIGTRVTIHE